MFFGFRAIVAGLFFFNSLLCDAHAQALVLEGTVTNVGRITSPFGPGLLKVLLDNGTEFKFSCPGQTGDQVSLLIGDDIYESEDFYLQGCLKVIDDLIMSGVGQNSRLRIDFLGPEVTEGLSFLVLTPSGSRVKFVPSGAEGRGVFKFVGSNPAASKQALTCPSNESRFACRCTPGPVIYHKICGGPSRGAVSQRYLGQFCQSGARNVCLYGWPSSERYLDGIVDFRN